MRRGGDTDGPRLRDQRPFILFWSAETVSGSGSYVTGLAISVLGSVGAVLALTPYRAARIGDAHTAG